MISNFYGREKELEILEDFYTREEFQNIIIYGRRRIGKTYLCNKFLENKDGLYFLCTKDNFSEQAQKLVDKFCFMKDIFSKKVKDFYECFEFIKEKVGGERFVLVLDEFPYLIEEDKKITSVFQYIIDEILKDSNIYLILLGSSISIMEQEVLGYKSPLYARRTGQIKVLPMEISDLGYFFKNKSFDEILKIYFVLDSIPAYLEKFDLNSDVYENLLNRILRKGEFLFEEVNFLLNQELREPKNYKRILFAVANGKKRLSEISNEIGISVNVLTNYLDSLIDLHILKKVYPITDKKGISRNSLYEFEDNFFRFYFRFIYNNLDLIEENKSEIVLDEIKVDFNKFSSFIFEDVTRQFIRKKENFKFVGNFWKKNVEIDLVAFSSKDLVLLGEVKYKDNVDVSRIYDKLVEKKEFLNEFKNFKYAIFAKSFKEKEKIMNQIETQFKDLEIYDLKDLEKEFIRKNKK